VNVYWYFFSLGEEFHSDDRVVFYGNYETIVCFFRRGFFWWWAYQERTCMKVGLVHSLPNSRGFKSELIIFTRLKRTVIVVSFFA